MVNSIRNDIANQISDRCIRCYREQEWYAENVLSHFIEETEFNGKRILEIGTYTGYATLCLAEGLTKDGSIDTLDKNEELFDFQRKYFDRSGYGSQIEQHLGNAIDIIPGLKSGYDLVFLDADKTNYLNYFELVLPIMNSGGVILSDNVLWSGKVIKQADPKDKDTQVLQEFNRLLATDPRIESVLLPLRDGLTLSRVR